MTDACTLTNKKCVPCEGGVQPLMREQIDAMLPQVDGWEVNDANTAITRHIKQKDFMAVVDLVNRIAEVAEAEGHHPDLSIHGYNKLDITLATHSIGGLSENDFIVAAKIDALV